MVAVTSNQREFIFKAVQDMYSEVANLPDKIFHFPTGRAACLFVGYPEEQLDGLPATAVESFAGVGCPFVISAIHKGDTVLDIGSGSGTDELIVAALAGPRGKVYGLDITAAMRAKFQTNIERMGANHIEVLEGNAEQIPLPDSSMDVVTSNGVLNLVPDKPRAFAEIFRVLRPGGRLQLADIVLANPVSDECRKNPQLWAECIVGAAQEDAYLEMFRAAGFSEVGVQSRLDYFAGSSNAETRAVAASFGACSIVMHARKPFQ